MNKSHSPIQAPSSGKTLEEAKKEFMKKRKSEWNYLDVGNEYTDQMWSWFESTLSLLTEQMIPEEKDVKEKMKKTKMTELASVIILNYSDGYNTAIEEMKQKREEILGK